MPARISTVREPKRLFSFAREAVEVAEWGVGFREMQINWLNCLDRSQRRLLRAPASAHAAAASLRRAMNSAAAWDRPECDVG